MDIYLRKKIVEEKRISEKGISVYCALRKIYNINEVEYYVSDNMLAYILTGKTEYQRRFIDSIHEGLMELINLNFVKIKTSISKKEYILDLSELYYCYSTKNVAESKDYFTTILLEELHTIMNITGNTDRFKLLRYFITLVGTFNQSTNLEEKYRGKVGGMPIEFLSSISKVSERVIIDYNNILTNEKLIYVYRFSDFLYSDNTIKTLPNGYGRFENKSLVDEYCLEKKSTQGYKTTNDGKVKKANKTKSVVMKYNALCNGKEYDKETIISIYQGIVEFNERTKKLGESYQDRIKDMSVFDKYDFLKWI